MFFIGTAKLEYIFLSPAFFITGKLRTGFLFFGLRFNEKRQIKYRLQNFIENYFHLKKKLLFTMWQFFLICITNQLCIIAQVVYTGVYNFVDCMYTWWYLLNTTKLTNDKIDWVWFTIIILLLFIIIPLQKRKASQQRVTSRLFSSSQLKTWCGEAETDKTHLYHQPLLNRRWEFNHLTKLFKEKYDNLRILLKIINGNLLVRMFRLALWLQWILKK